MAKRQTKFSTWPWALVSAVGLPLGCYTGYPLELDPVDEPEAAGSSTGDDEVEPESESGEPVEDGCELPPRGLRRLTPTQYDRTVATITDIDPEAPPSAGFVGSWILTDQIEATADHLTLATPHVSQLMTVAESLGEQVALDPSRLAECMPALGADATCVESFVEELLRRVFRREPDAEQAATYQAFFADQRSEYDTEMAIQLTVQRALMSPDFLFRTELGDGGGDDLTELDAFERASLVSYVLTDGPPDDELYAAARDGDLLDPDVMEAQVQRLLSSRATAEGVVHFMKQYLDSDAVTLVTKDAELFPNFDEQLAASMAQETEEFVAHVLWEDDGTLSTMLTADYTVANDRLGELYGLEEPLTEEFSRVQLPPERQAGVLGHASFLAAHANETSTSIVMRGLYITESLLCIHAPEPPDEVADAMIEVDPSVTQREQLAQHREDPVCAACHGVFDPLGFPLESFDAVGAFRETENELPLDLVATLPQPVDPEQATVRDVNELGERLAQLDGTYNCFAEQLFTYTSGTIPSPRSCQIDDLREVARQTSGSVSEVITAFITSEGFFSRAAPTGDSE